MNARTYKTKPTQIKAMHFVDATIQTVEDIVKWIFAHGHKCRVASVDGKDVIIIGTLEGDMIASVGDYIIQGVASEFYPCKPDIFKRKYELVGWEKQRDGDMWPEVKSHGFNVLSVVDVKNIDTTHQKMGELLSCYNKAPDLIIMRPSQWNKLVGGMELVIENAMPYYNGIRVRFAEGI